MTTQKRAVRLIPREPDAFSAFVAALVQAAGRTIPVARRPPPVAGSPSRPEAQISVPNGDPWGTLLAMNTAIRRKRQPTSETVRLIGYVRVSTEDQADKGVSLAAQRERLAAFAAAHGYRLLRIEEDAGVSGKVAPARRPALGRALAAIRAGEADGLVALKLDRLSRSTRDTLSLVEDAERAGWRLLSVSESLDTGSAAGRMVVTILAALAQMEREQIGERTSFGMEQIAREGRARSYRLPFGYRVQGSLSTTLVAGNRAPLVEDPWEQAILGRMLALQASGMGARRIARVLGAAGTINPRTQRAFQPSLVAKLLNTASRRAATLGALAMERV